MTCCEDPSGFDAGDANLFRYAGNDPINNTALTRLQFDKPTLLTGTTYAAPVASTITDTCGSSCAATSISTS